MTRTSPINLFVFLVLLKTTAAISQPLTLDKLFSLLQDHPLLQSEALGPQVEQYNQDVALSAKNWRVRANQTYYYSQPVTSTTFSASEIQQVAFTGSVKKAFWATGGRLSLQWSSDLTQQEFPTLRFPGPGGGSSFNLGLDRLYKNSLRLTYSQPLWQNYGGTLDRLDYELSQYSIQTSRLRSLENQEEFYLRVGQAFIDWSLLSEQRDIVQERLQLAREELQLVRDKRANFLVDSVDVLRAQDAVRIVRQNVLLLESQYRATRTRLVQLTEQPQIRNMQPEFALYDTVNVPLAETVYKQLKDSSRVLRELQQQHQRLQRLMESFQERQDPQLDFQVNAGFVGGNGQFDQALDITQPDIRLSLNFLYPLGTRASALNAQKTELQLRQLSLQQSNLFLNLKARLADLLVQLEDLKAILRLNREQIQSAETLLQEEQRMYNQGRGQLRFVLQSRDNIQNARLTLAENAANYHRLVLQYREITDQLIQE